MACGCVWGKEPRYGAETVVSPCAEHAAERARLVALERSQDLIANDNLARRMLDIEMDNVVCGRRR